MLLYCEDSSARMVNILCDVQYLFFHLVTLGSVTATSTLKEVLASTTTPLLGSKFQYNSL